MREFNTSFVKSEDELKDFIYLTPYKSHDGTYDIDDHFIDINNAIKYFDDELSMLQKAADVMTWYDVTYNSDELNEKIKDLTNKKNDLFVYMVKVKNVLLDKQKCCSHEEKHLRYTGYDHSYNYYECERCGKEIKE
jgi:hypothetical protein